MERIIDGARKSTVPDSEYPRIAGSRLTMLSRRSFLVRSLLGGTAAAATWACGTEHRALESLQIVGLFSSSFVIVAGIPQRLPFGLIDPSEELTDDEPLEVHVRRDGASIEQLTVHGHVVTHDHAPGVEDHEHASIQRYYPLRTTLPEPGIYDLEISAKEQTLRLPVQAFAPAEVPLPLPGQPFPRLETPTLTFPRGVDPVCTRFEGPCPFHTRTAAEVMDAGLPMALLVATPAYCSTSYCGPVLSTLIEASSSAPDVAMVHVEPWANPTEGSGLNDPDLRTAPTVDALALSFEPALFLVDRTGTVIDRIDNVFDMSELEAALATIS